MTVQELIDILSKVEDKSKNVNVETSYFEGEYVCQDARIVYECKDLDIGIIISDDLENEQNEDRIIYA